VNVLVKKYHVSAQELALVKLTRVHMYGIVITAVIALQYYYSYDHPRPLL